MKKLLLALTLLAFAPQLATAQEAKVAVIPEKVTYSRAVPKALRAFVPRGGKSRFWGATKLKYNGQQVWVHVYDVQKTSADGQQKRGIDLFVLSKSQHLLRVSTNRFKNVREPGETFGVETLWLDPQTKKRPIIKVAFQCEGILGPITEYVFVVFDQNLKNAIIQHQFGKGDTNGSGWSSYNTSFGVDEKGLLTVLYYQGGTGGERITTYKWKENLFRPTERVGREGLGENNPYLPVPLTDD